MMATTIRKGINSAIVFAVILVFLMLIGFNQLAANLIGKIFGASSSDPSQIYYLGIFLAVIGIWAGGRSAKAETREEATFGTALTAGLASGVLLAFIIGLFAWFMGSIYANGTDLRTYLSALSPPVIRFYNFNQAPLTGAIVNFVLLLAASLAGAFLERYFFTSQGVRGFPKKIAGLFRTPMVRNSWSNPATRYVLIVLGIAAAIILPRIWGSYWNYVMGTVGIYVLLGLGLNIIVGQSGQLVLGYVAYFAVGAYTVALLMAPTPLNIGTSFWVALPLAVILGALLGILTGLPIMGLRSDYLAIVTLGFGEIIRIMLKSDVLTSFTGGPKGVPGIPLPTIFGKTFGSDVDYMYMIIIAMVITIFVTNRLMNSRTGRAWIAIREDETVAKATGINTTFYKLLALAIGGAFAGLGGAIFASRNQFTGPEDHVLMVSINVLCLVIVGGMGSIPGAILGAFALKGLPEILREFETYRMLAFGMLLVVMMIVRPEGLWPASRPRLENVNEKEKPPTPSMGQQEDQKAEVSL
jgi:ABC-type branched-subunit amino acid transport system permease subunit